MLFINFCYLHDKRKSVPIHSFHSIPWNPLNEKNICNLKKKNYCFAAVRCDDCSYWLQYLGIILVGEGTESPIGGSWQWRWGRERKEIDEGIKIPWTFVEVHLTIGFDRLVRANGYHRQQE